MHPRCMHTVSIREPVISSGWHGIHTGGRTCLSCLKAEGKTMPGGFLSSPVFPTLRHLLMSSAALINCVLRGNPALCFQALLAVMRGLGCSLISAKVPFKRVSVFSKIPPSSLTFSPQLSPLKTLLAADVCWFADMSSTKFVISAASKQIGFKSTWIRQQTVGWIFHEWGIVKVTRVIQANLIKQQPKKILACGFVS